MIPIDHSQLGREPIMASINRTYISLYDPRIRLVDDALKQNSKLGEKRMSNWPGTSSH